MRWNLAVSPETDKSLAFSGKSALNPITILLSHFWRLRQSELIQHCKNTQRVHIIGRQQYIDTIRIFKAGGVQRYPVFESRAEARRRTMNYTPLKN